MIQKIEANFHVCYCVMEDMAGAVEKNNQLVLTLETGKVDVIFY